MNACPSTCLLVYINVLSKYLYESRLLNEVLSYIVELFVYFVEICNNIRW